MLCKIAELYVDVPEAGGMAPRCKEYLWDGKPDAEVFTIQEALYDVDFWNGADYELICYMESGHQFHKYLTYNSGFRLHASALKWNEKAFLFSAPCGTGKSTHGKMWQQLYGEDAVTVINDDKPSMRLLDGKWYAYGTPWCGKDGINQNIKVPVAGICFLEQGPENRIRRMEPAECIGRMMDQTIWQWLNQEEMNLLLDSMDKLIRRIPIYLLECTPTTDAAKLSSETMLQGAIDAGL